MSEIKLLTKWVERNSPAEIAAYLGYKSSSTISMWIRQGKIPDYQKRSILNFLKEQGDHSDKKMIKKKGRVQI